MICGRSRERGERVRARLAELGSEAVFVPADLTSEDDCRAIVRACEDRFDRLDGLVNSAGLTNRGTLDDTTVELWDRIFAVNVRAPFVLMQEAARLMRRGGDGGSIVNIITMASHGGEPVLTAYVELEGSAGDPHQERRLPAPARPHPGQRPQHRLDRDRGRGRDPARDGPARRLAGGGRRRQSARAPAGA